MIPRPRRLAAAALAAVLLAWSAAAASAAELPARIRQAGVVRIAVNAIYPPMEYKDPATGRLTGVDIELGEAMARRLGIRLEWQESSFEQLIPSVTTGRADMILSGLSDLPARREALDFIDYMRSGAQFYVPAVSPVQAQTDLCGKRVATSRSTSFPAGIREWSAANCEGAGRPAIEVVGAESTADARAQMRQGRVDAAVQGSETLPYIMGLEPNTYRPVGGPFTTVYQGMAFTKAESALRDAFAEALDGIVADGTYAGVLGKYNLSGNALTQRMMNGAPRQ